MVDVAYLIRSERHHGLMILRYFEEVEGGRYRTVVADGPAECASDLGAVVLDGRIYEASVAKELDEVGIEDVVDLLRHDGTAEEIFKTTDVEDQGTVIEVWRCATLETSVLLDDLYE